ncbi:mitochondrial inner membrane protein OXA1L isoform X2 [Odontomachus brunneus]|uniref:mitochondrial inner membrane protein OXA1L isoform X2 n=1 Tax=Odontomachus brunneus TaxID=486640 RepID=UPI0013F18B52|nr:mitochondrial inner membrane protein OXA1L isoform X2 [Odontomachus brunneus]
MLRIFSIPFRQTLSRANKISQEVPTCRYIHSVSQVRGIPKHNSLLNLYSNYRVTGIPLVRYASTNKETSAQINPYDEIPDPPTPIEEIIEEIVKYHPNGEITFQSLGLGGYTPVGLVQNALECMHISLNMPWWTTIVIGTVILRCLIFPLVIYSQKNMAKFTNHLPKIQELQAQMTEARQSGDHYESARCAAELADYMKKNNIKVGKNFLVPFIQGPIFLSCFLALRKMANLPVDSMKEGGFLWMQDLTMHDPYYIMPIFTCVTLYITIEIGADGTNIKTLGMMRYVLRVIPFAILPFMINFPGAILTYWASTNFISLIQTSILKIPRIKKSLKIPDIHHAPKPKSKKNFMEEIKQSWTNIKITKQMSDREQADVVQFNAAGKGPIVKTFKYDPTKQKETTVLTKGR